MIIASSVIIQFCASSVWIFDIHCSQPFWIKVQASFLLVFLLYYDYVISLSITLESCLLQCWPTTIITLNVWDGFNFPQHLTTHLTLAGTAKKTWEWHKCLARSGQTERTFHKEKGTPTDNHKGGPNSLFEWWESECPSDAGKHSVCCEPWLISRVLGLIKWYQGKSPWPTPTRLHLSCNSHYWCGVIQIVWYFHILCLWIFF